MQKSVKKHFHTQDLCLHTNLICAKGSARKGIFMNELEKCMAGKWYNCHDDIFLEYKNNARNLLSQYNSFSYNQKKKRQKF